MKFSNYAAGQINDQVNLELLADSKKTVANSDSCRFKDRVDDI